MDDAELNAWLESQGWDFNFTPDSALNTDVNSWTSIAGLDEYSDARDAFEVLSGEDLLNLPQDYAWPDPDNFTYADLMNDVIAPQAATDPTLWSRIFGNTAAKTAIEGASSAVKEKGLMDYLESLSGAELGLGATGILAALSALTSDAQTTTGNTSQNTATSQDTSGTSEQTQSGTSSQQQAGTSTQDTESTQNQSQTGSTTQQQSGTSSQQQAGTSTQDTASTQTQQQTGTQKQTTETTLPQWYLDMIKQQAEGAQNLTGATEFAKTMLDMPVDQYMDPYLEQVANPVMRRLSEDQAKQRQEFDAQRVARGAFGTSRADLLENQMAERQALEQDNALSSLYSQAFGNAQSVAGADLNRMFQEWQTMQQDPRNLAAAQANILSTLKPGQITSSTGVTDTTSLGSTTGSTTGATTGTTTGATTSDILGTSASNLLGSTTGSTTGATTGTTTGATTGTSTGATTGTTTGATNTTGDTSYTGADPNRLGQLASIGGTVWGMANPNGLQP